MAIHPQLPQSWSYELGLGRRVTYSPRSWGLPEQRSETGGRRYPAATGFVERDQHDEDAFPAGAVVRRLRWRRRGALPDEPRGALVLVPDLAGAAGRPGRGLEADRCAAAPAQVRGRRARGHEPRPGGDAYLDAVVRLRRAHRRGAQGTQARPQDRDDRRQGRGRARKEPA